MNDKLKLLSTISMLMTDIADGEIEKAEITLLNDYEERTTSEDEWRKFRDVGKRTLVIRYKVSTFDQDDITFDNGICECQGDDDPIYHAHYPDDPHRCARCIQCIRFRPAANQRRSLKR